jgi:polysaccharide export outer membrane protein
MKSYRKLLVLAAGLMAALAATGQTATSTADDAAASKAPAGEFQQRNARYTLRGSDTFDVNFEMTPEYNQALVSVQPDGFVTLRGIGEVKVAGQTVPEATQTIAQAYSKILNHPLISITLRDFQKPFFVADGQLGHPGRYELRGDVTLTEAIAMAGGFTEASKHSTVILYRRINDQWMKGQLIDVKKMELAHDLHEDPLLQPGDMVFVPKNAFSKYKAFLPTTNAGVSAYQKTY